MSVTDAGGGAWPTTVELTRLFSNSISTSENRLTTPTLGTIKYFTRQAFFFKISSFLHPPTPFEGMSVICFRRKYCASERARCSGKENESHSI